MSNPIFNIKQDILQKSSGQHYVKFNWTANENINTYVVNTCEVTTTLEMKKYIGSQWITFDKTLELDGDALGGTGTFKSGEFEFPAGSDVSTLYGDWACKLSIFVVDTLNIRTTYSTTRTETIVSPVDLDSNPFAIVSTPTHSVPLASMTTQVAFDSTLLFGNTIADVEVIYYNVTDSQYIYTSKIDLYGDTANTGSTGTFYIDRNPNTPFNILKIKDTLKVGVAGGTGSTVPSFKVSDQIKTEVIVRLSNGQLFRDNTSSATAINSLATTFNIIDITAGTTGASGQAVSLNFTAPSFDVNGDDFQGVGWSTFKYFVNFTIRKNDDTEVETQVQFGNAAGDEVVPGTANVKTVNFPINASYVNISKISLEIKNNNDYSFLKTADQNVDHLFYSLSLDDDGNFDLFTTNNDKSVVVGITGLTESLPTNTRYNRLISWDNGVTGASGSNQITNKPYGDVTSAYTINGLTNDASYIVNMAIDVYDSTTSDNNNAFVQGASGSISGVIPHSFNDKIRNLEAYWDSDNNTGALFVNLQYGETGLPPNYTLKMDSNVMDTIASTQDGETGLYYYRYNFNSTLSAMQASVGTIQTELGASTYVGNDGTQQIPTAVYNLSGVTGVSLNTMPSKGETGANTLWYNSTDQDDQVMITGLDATKNYEYTIQVVNQVASSVQTYDHNAGIQGLRNNLLHSVVINEFKSINMYNIAGVSAGATGAAIHSAKQTNSAVTLQIVSGLPIHPANVFVDHVNSKLTWDHNPTYATDGADTDFVVSYLAKVSGSTGSFVSTDSKITIYANSACELQLIENYEYKNIKIFKVQPDANDPNYVHSSKEITRPDFTTLNIAAAAYVNANGADSYTTDIKLTISVSSNNNNNMTLSSAIDANSTALSNLSALFASIQNGNSFEEHIEYTFGGITGATGQANDGLFADLSSAVKKNPKLDTISDTLTQVNANIQQDDTVFLSGQVRARLYLLVNGTKEYLNASYTLYKSIRTIAAGRIPTLNVTNLIVTPTNNGTQQVLIKATPGTNAIQYVENSLGDTGLGTQYKIDYTAGTTTYTDTITKENLLSILVSTGYTHTFSNSSANNIYSGIKLWVRYIDYGPDGQLASAGTNISVADSDILNKDITTGTGVSVTTNNVLSTTYSAITALNNESTCDTSNNQLNVTGTLPTDNVNFNNPTIKLIIDGVTGNNTDWVVDPNDHKILKPAQGVTNKNLVHGKAYAVEYTYTHKNGGPDLIVNGGTSVTFKEKLTLATTELEIQTQNDGSTGSNLYLKIDDNGNTDAYYNDLNTSVSKMLLVTNTGVESLSVTNTDVYSAGNDHHTAEVRLSYVPEWYLILLENCNLYLIKDYDITSDMAETATSAI